MKNKKSFWIWKIVNVIFWLAYGLVCVWVMTNWSMLPHTSKFGVWFIESVMVVAICVALWRIYSKSTESYDKYKERTKKFLTDRIAFYNKEIARYEKEMSELDE